MYECDRVIDRGRAGIVYNFRKKLDHRIEKWEKDVI